ncbi:TPA: LOW QUALITY PROTEIN: hypothetical protein N0F65_011767 [Lagenidium giganteum]|uniref:Uncharacterized protein n=1 Tax=Lagenidium giganteum TaxID=4803 RepID=A0AAV2YRV7_9STRA|nr:TPA: LOW QUALITY PROTEIN: hypothetical protein N0F65_011767 [Lagenidium giganteum]
MAARSRPSTTDENDECEVERRVRHPYTIPSVGQVCRPVFSTLYSVTEETVQRQRARVMEGVFDADLHGNSANSRCRGMSSCREEYAAEIGSLAPLRVRRQSLVEWQDAKLHTVMQHKLTHVDDLVSLSYFRQEMTKRLPKVVIASPHRNVCEVCVIYVNHFKKTPDASAIAVFGKHTQTAKKLRSLYKNDVDNASEDNMVITIDYSQNFSLPSRYETPSQWYVWTLHWANLFAIHAAHTKTNYGLLCWFISKMESELRFGYGPTRVDAVCI